MLEILFVLLCAERLFGLAKRKFGLGLYGLVAFDLAALAALMKLCVLSR